MLTLVHGHNSESVKVSSKDGDVVVKVPSAVAGLPETMLTREETHSALVEAKEKARNFIAAVEGDIEATAA